MRQNSLAHKRRGLRLLGVIVLLLPVLFLGLFFFYPLVNIFRLSITAAAFYDLAQRPYFRSILWFTFWQAGLSTLLTLLAGLPAVWIGYQLSVLLGPERLRDGFAIFLLLLGLQQLFGRAGNER